MKAEYSPILTFYLKDSLMKVWFSGEGSSKVFAFRKNIHRNVKTSQKGRKFQMLSISLFFLGHFGFPLLEILPPQKKNGRKEDIAQMFLLNCPRTSENGEKT